ncbi:carbamoyltransferase HypF [Seleniivibrio woodruffii]|uniref:carbamoyltransferase HypF n=1 Tax=Seleniivibrio woodruffii TaxID=1078050 RepID=UPI0026EA2C69|nr:carbamoyltransferase HypF [Seleniivibrio woodruffii]
MKTFILHINGIVQGVGFRPFVYNLAVARGINGSVVNSGRGVEVQINAQSLQDAENLLHEIIKNAPPLAHITESSVSEATHTHYEGFTIEKSTHSGGLSLVPPDTAICPNCAKEISDPSDRRFEYPFTNCTDCGPRYTIMLDMPYDRPRTVMSEFTMCPDCRNEYLNPADRRFHAQPNACPVCGPSVSYRHLTGIEAVIAVAKLIDSGELVAVKGLGGYHLICDAANDAPIRKLRELKKRPDKPLAVMALPETLERLNISEPEKNLLFSQSAPIVVLECDNHEISPLVCPMSGAVGYMTAYTPLHMVLMKYLKTKFIVATSGNLKDEPIAKDPHEAEETLSLFTEHFLHHNRPIHNRCDDSLAAVVNGYPYIMRRARGFAPYPVILPSKSEKCVIGTGAHLKSTVTLAKDGYGFVSQYIGDLDNPATCSFYDETVKKMQSLYGLTPETVVCDLHPDYHGTRYARSLGIDTIEVQHHLAHMFACMAENGLTDNVVGIILDGTGLGTDRTIWGGEFFVMKDMNISRALHLPSVPQPGLDSAAKNPARMLVSYLNSFGLLKDNIQLVTAETGLPEKDISFITTMTEKNINCISTTSTGRMFESAGALITQTPVNLFEAHAAMKLEGFCCDNTRTYNISSPDELFSCVIDDLNKGTDRRLIASAFHNGFADWIFSQTVRLCSENSITDAVISGGVFQNIFLVRRLVSLFAQSPVRLHLHSKVPPNDGCISLGQAFFANFHKLTNMNL